MLIIQSTQVKRVVEERKIGKKEIHFHNCTTMIKFESTCILKKMKRI